MKKNIHQDKRIIMTLDAGGTNFVFSALQGGREIILPIILSANTVTLENCLNTIIQGFEKVKSILPVNPVAISFAFPGPADYKNGIIGDLPNLHFFRGGVALGSLLEEIFGIPTFINNDGDLFTYGEAMAGILPEINKKLKCSNADKEFKNLVGLTLGTGFGGGIVCNGQLCTGDNSAAGEIWLMRNFSNTRIIAEEAVSIRAVKRVYEQQTGVSNLTPKEIYDIAVGTKKGSQLAAEKAFDQMAIVIAESLANALTLIDGAVVIGGGMSGASKFIIPKIITYLNGTIENLAGDKIPRLVSQVYNIDDEQSLQCFMNWKPKEIEVPFIGKSIKYNAEKKIPIGLSRLGTSKAIALGAYAYAVNQLSRVT